MQEANILIIGSAGTGKSTLGRDLSQALNYSFVEKDQLILKKTGYDNIHEAYADDPFIWKEVELETSKDLAKKNRQVIVCGGGITDNTLNIDYFKYADTKTIVIFVSSNSTVVANRLLHKDNKYFIQKDLTALTHKLEEIFRDRLSISTRIADFCIDTSDLDPAQTFEKTMDFLHTQDILS